MTYTNVSSPLQGYENRTSFGGRRASCLPSLQVRGGVARRAAARRVAMEGRRPPTVVFAGGPPIPDQVGDRASALTGLACDTSPRERGAERSLTTLPVAMCECDSPACVRIARAKLEDRR